MQLSNEQIKRQKCFPFVLDPTRRVHIPVDDDEEQVISINPFKLDKSKPVNLSPEVKTIDLEPLDRKTLRRSSCGKRLGKEFKATDGTYVKGHYHCGLWRDGFCPACAKYRSTRARRQAQKALVKAMHDNDRLLKRVVTDEAGAKSLCAKLKKDEYQRFPQEDGSYIFLVDSDKDVDATGEAEELCWDDIEEMDWEQLIQTPENRRITGSLGKQPDGLKEEQVIIKAPVFTVHPETTPEQEIKALQATFEATKHLDPQTPEELEEALKERTETFKTELKKVGGKMLHRISLREQKVYMGNVAWNNSYTCVLSNIENMVRVEENEEDDIPDAPLVA